MIICGPCRFLLAPPAGRYFPTKAQVVEAVFAELQARFTPGLEEILDNAAGLSDAAVIERVVDHNFSFFIEEENLALIVLGLTTAEGFDGRAMDAVREQMVPYVARIAGALERGMKSGTFRTGDPLLASMALFGLMQMTVFHKLLAGAAYSFDEARAEVKRIFFRGILANPTQPGEV